MHAGLHGPEGDADAFGDLEAGSTTLLKQTVVLEHDGGVRSHLWMSATAPVGGRSLRVSGTRAGIDAGFAISPDATQLVGRRLRDLLEVAAHQQTASSRTDHQKLGSNSQAEVEPDAVCQPIARDHRGGRDIVTHADIHTRDDLHRVQIERHREINA